jgi:hypothetical protein
MHEAVEPLVEMYEWVKVSFRLDLKDLTPEEIEWRLEMTFEETIFLRDCFSESG